MTPLNRYGNAKLMIPIEENRHFVRAQANCPMTFRLADHDQYFDGVCFNISASGILFQSEHFIAPGKAVEIHIRPENQLSPVLIAFIEIVRNTQTDRGEYQIAGAIKGIKSN